MWWLLLLPIFWVFIDVFASVKARRAHTFVLRNDRSLQDFQVLVPIYGSVRYLKNAKHLRQYGRRVILCTTSGEADEFYSELDELAAAYGFTVYRSPYVPPAASGKRRTGGTIRDRIVRDALNDVVTMPYTVCIDADTTTARSLSVLVGELHHQAADLASIRLVPQKIGRMIVQLQRHEYYRAMRMRLIAPWLVSGACHVGTTKALQYIMNRHSLFFQGNDVETGLLGEQLGYKVVHIPFDVYTDVPDTWTAWWRQRLAWSGGEFRLFIANFRYISKHPFFWIYGAIISILMVELRWYALSTPTLALVWMALLYWGVVIWLHWSQRNWWLLLLPIYSLFISLVLTPIGIVWYFVMAVPERNFGIIRTKERLNSDHV